ncbi:MAG: prenyltransferase [Candidatus Binatia bacterium]|nr:prenyltransferase [Candidatus Binatia bacterium]
MENFAQSVCRWGRGFWRLADPRITLASMASIAVAGAAAWAARVPLWPWLGAIVLAIFALEWAKNASGEIVDFRSGADLKIAPEDRSPFSGGKRVLVEGILTERETALVAAVGYAICGLIGVVIVVQREPVALPLGVVGALLAFFYHAPPLRLAYRGFGELAVFLAYGPLLMNGSYRVLTRLWSGEVAWLSVTYGLLVAAFLWINEFPDAKADEAAGKRTWVVRLGKARAARAFVVLLLAAWLWFAAGLLGGVLRWPVALGFAGTLPALLAARRLCTSWQETQNIVLAQANTLFTFVAFAAGVALGFAASAR